MKSNPLRTFFEWALITSVLMSVGFCAYFLIKSHAERASNYQFGNSQAIDANNRAFLSSLGTQCQEYAKTNAEFARFFAALGQASPAPGSNAKPATR